MRILNIIENAYRGTLEEQDDTILWLSGALRKGGAELTILLRGSAVNYAIPQQCPPLAIGDTGIHHPAHPYEDIRKLGEAGVEVFVLEDDLEARGLSRDRTNGQVAFVRSGDIASLFDSHDQVWHW
jgi:sulfur transfer complex TusBCD TusB component (DsrH family)